MELEIHNHDEVVVVKPLDRRIDALTSGAFREKFLQLIHHEGNLFILNLSSVEFMDSSGLSALIWILKTLKKEEGVLILCHVSPYIYNLFSITRLNLVFNIVNEENEAIQTIRKMTNHA